MNHAAQYCWASLAYQAGHNIEQILTGRLDEVIGEMRKLEKGS